jgi:hypothetical protein
LALLPLWLADLRSINATRLIVLLLLTRSYSEDVQTPVVRVNTHAGPFASITGARDRAFGQSGWHQALVCGQFVNRSVACVRPDRYPCRSLRVRLCICALRIRGCHRFTV